MRFELARDVELLLEIGERNANRVWELASTVDHLSAELEAAGYAVERQGYQLEDDVVAQNLVAEVKGGTLGDEVVIVGAHYDTALGSPGADDNATGVAAVLALARWFHSRPCQRTLRFVLFAAESPPYTKTPQMGSMVYARHALGQGDRLLAMVGLRSIGFFSEQDGTQQRPGELAASFPEVGRFVSVLGNESSRELTEQVAKVMTEHASIQTASVVLSDPEQSDVAASGHWAFQQLGVPAVLVTDTCRLRNPHCATATDTVDTVDFVSMARVVAGIEHVIRQIGGGAATDDSNPH